MEQVRFDLSRLGVREIAPGEARTIEGGFVPFLIIGAAILLGGCGNTIINNYGNGNQVAGTSSADSSGNGSASGNKFP